MNRLFDWLRRFLYGRYGNDALGMATLIGYLAFSVLSSAMNNLILMIPALILLIVYFYRFMSRRTAARYQENQVFLRIWGGVKRFFTHPVAFFKDHLHYAYFTCPTCKQKLRVPRKKGKVRVHCPKCGTEFIKKT